MDITEQKETKESLQEFDALKASILTRFRRQS